MSSSEALQVTPSGEREITLERIFEAPRGLVFDMLTKPDMVKKWLLGPPGWRMEVCSIDVKEGGAYRYEWHHTDGSKRGVRGIFREIVRPQRIVHTEVFDDPVNPREAVVKTNLIEVGGKTSFRATLVYPSRAMRDAVLGHVF